jgi:hypothetical protein
MFLFVVLLFAFCVYFLFYPKCLYLLIGGMFQTMFMTCETYSHSILTRMRPLYVSCVGMES